MIYFKGISLETLEKSTKYSCRNTLSQGKVSTGHSRIKAKELSLIQLVRFSKILFEFMGNYI